MKGAGTGKGKRRDGLVEYLIVGVERLTFRVQAHEVGSQATMLWARDHSRTLARVVKNGVWLERGWSVVGERARVVRERQFAPMPGAQGVAWLRWAWLMACRR
ncbi:MAG: hypothetical protein FRX48_02166 [Lasallia pustulata]|uniref:Uncharacterized protein n=1 Tax=Lasallia pustulata TaxID=136370 RepID=A0A5M8PVY5_9LECA|nr:MAG: hypothetical protein FRX48_02166 [Lasallia pustulata]